MFFFFKLVEFDGESDGLKLWSGRRAGGEARGVAEERGRGLRSEVSRSRFEKNGGYGSNAVAKRIFECLLSKPSHAPFQHFSFSDSSCDAPMTCESSDRRAENEHLEQQAWSGKGPFSIGDGGGG